MIGERSFYGRTRDRVGVELEWHTTPSSDPYPVDVLHEILTGAEPLPGGSRLSFEPGAQIELSSPALSSWADACDAVASDTSAASARLEREGIGIFAAGLDGDRSLDLRTDGARYVAMRSYFDRYGPAGGRMMCATAAIHLNLDAGDDAEGTERWRAAHALGPTLVAAFANSASAHDRAVAWKSGRFDTWRTLDPSRTSPVANGHRPAESWAEYALDAQVMFIRGADVYEPLDEPLSLRGWIEDGHRLGYPGPDDVAYHLTTLFPPVRPHGWLELRMIDMLPDPWWRVAVAVTTTLVCEGLARPAALEAASGTEELWDIAARCATEDPQLHASARACFEIALRQLERSHPDHPTTADVHEYYDRFVLPGRCPADEQVAHMLPTASAEAI